MGAKESPKIKLCNILYRHLVQKSIPLPTFLAILYKLFYGVEIHHFSAFFRPFSRLCTIVQLFSFFVFIVQSTRLFEGNFPVFSSFLLLKARDYQARHFLPFLRHSSSFLVIFPKIFYIVAIVGNRGMLSFSPLMAIDFPIHKKTA